jgi:hypothetical protein
MTRLSRTASIVATSFSPARRSRLPKEVEEVEAVAPGAPVVAAAVRPLEQVQAPVVPRREAQYCRKLRYGGNRRLCWNRLVSGQRCVFRSGQQCGREQFGQQPQRDRQFLGADRAARWHELGRYRAIVRTGVGRHNGHGRRHVGRSCRPEGKRGHRSQAQRHLPRLASTSSGSRVALAQSGHRFSTKITMNIMHKSQAKAR